MQFQLNENRINFLLCILGMVCGLTIGYLIKDGAKSFDSFEIFSYDIPSFILFGIVTGLTIQITSVLLSMMACLGNDLYYNRIFCLLISMPIGILIIFNVFSSYLITLGFVIPYIINILLPSWIVMRIVGWNTTYLVLANASSLLSIYIIPTGIVWLIESLISIV